MKRQVIPTRTRAERIVIAWAYRMAHRLADQPVAKAKAHPLAQIQELALGPGRHAPTGKETAHGVETRRYSKAPDPGIEAPAQLPEDEGDRIMQVVGLLTFGAEIRSTLYLWGLGLADSEQARVRQLDRREVKTMREAGFAAVELAILGRWYR